MKKLKTQKTEKVAGSGKDQASLNQRPNLVIEQQLKIPILRCATSRMIMQRIINRYLTLGDKVRDDMGNLITYEIDAARNKSLFPPYKMEKDE